MKKKRITYNICLLCCIGLFLSSCRPDGVLSQKEMENALFDVYLAQSLSQSAPRYATPESRDSLFAQVMAKYHITQAEFDSSVVWYSNQGETYYKINNRVSKRLQNFQKTFGGDDKAGIKSRKKYDGYTLPPSVLLGGRGCPSYFGFDIDSLKLKNDVVDTMAFDFNFKTLGIASRSSAYAEVSFEYKDTLVKIRRILSYNTFYSIKKPLFIKSKLTKISGYIRMENSPEQIFPVFIYELRYKKEKPKPRRKSEPESKKNETKSGLFGTHKKEPNERMERMEKVEKEDK